MIDVKPKPDLNIKEVLLQHRIVLCGGSGGVGKTTTAAALGVVGAGLGRRTLVVTIDPARRLANAMGLESLEPLPQPVPGIEGLFAMMLDPGRTIDELVTRHAKTPEGAARLLSNPYYQQVSSSLAGSREFMAMEKLYELQADESYDLIIVDTPPTQHALDFLDAPKRMLELLDGSGIGAIMRSTNLFNRLSFGMLHRSQKQMATLFEKLTGHQLLMDVTDFFHSYAEVIDGFKLRAAKIQDVLKSDSATFLLVLIAEENLLHQANEYARALGLGHMNLSGAIINQTIDLSDVVELEKLKADARQQDVPRSLIDRALACHSQWYGQAKWQQTAIETWEDETGLAVVQVPRFGKNVSSTEDLNHFSRVLTGERFEQG